MEGEQNQNQNMNGEAGGSAGPVIGGIIILAVIVLGALYFWGQRDNGRVENVEQTVEMIETQDESDTTSSIEADLDATNLDALEMEINAS